MTGELRRSWGLRCRGSRHFRQIASVAIKPGAGCQEESSITFANKWRNALAFARSLDFAAYKIRKARQARAAQFFVGLRTDRASALVGRTRMMPPRLSSSSISTVALQERSVEYDAILLPMHYADTPHQLDRTFGASDFKQLLKHLRAAEIEGDCPTPRYLLVDQLVQGPAIHRSIAVAIVGRSSRRSFKSNRGGAFSGSPRFRRAFNTSSGRTSPFASAASRSAAETVASRCARASGRRAGSGDKMIQLDKFLRRGAAAPCVLVADLRARQAPPGGCAGRVARSGGFAYPLWTRWG